MSFWVIEPLHVQLALDAECEHVDMPDEAFVVLLVVIFQYTFGIVLPWLPLHEKLSLVAPEPSVLIVKIHFA